jgi:4-amino-4-deoxy-L-arabinose transferase-like glycosyltransferase
MHIVLWALALAFCVARFLYLTADFPNDSPWMIDQAKFTDEGWWGGAAVMHALVGRWYVTGDYNPAVALPVWPVLLGVAFHFTGVSLAAARALNVLISIATLAAVYFLVRRFTAGARDAAALLAVLVLAASPFAFVFCRLAILDSLVVFEFCIALLLASYATARRVWPLVAVSGLICAMMLTKTTAAMLLAAIFWMMWSARGRNLRDLPAALLSVVVVPAGVLKGYALLVGAMGYGADYRYFFSVNAMPEIDWRNALATLGELFQNGFWIDRVLYPAALPILVLAAFWRRRLWSNALFTASWLAIAAQAAFIFSRQEDYAPRYFLVMLAPVTLIVVLACVDSLNRPRGRLDPGFAALLLLAMAGSVVANGFTIGGFLTHRDYDLRNAATSIAAIVSSHPEQKGLILGVSGDQISLMTGIASINDGFGTEEMAEKVARYEPGWYLAWNDVASEGAEYLAPYRLEKMASYVVFDDEERSTLTLYKMVRLAAGGAEVKGDSPSVP